MANFDLNIHNYTQKDLEEMFNLNDSYQFHELEENSTKLVNNIMSNTEVTEDVKKNTIDFINKAKSLLETSSMPNITSVDVKSQPKPLPPSVYQPTHASDYFPPIINPVKKENRNIVLNIDSRFRENYYVSQSSNFHVTLPMKINSVVNMKLSAIEFPPTAFFSVSKTLANNYFWLRAGSQTAGDLEETIIELPDGNYTPSDTCTLINTYLQTRTTSTYLQYIFFSVNESGNSGSGQLIVGINTSFPFATPFTFEIDLQSAKNGTPDFSTPLPLKLGWKLGFRNGKYTGNSSYISEGVLNLNGASYVYLSVDDYNNYSNTFFSAFNESLLNKNILARIAVQSSRGNAITFSNIGIVSTAREYYGPVDIERLHIQMLDEYGRNINLNNMDFSFVISFTTGTQVAAWPNPNEGLGENPAS